MHRTNSTMQTLITFRNACSVEFKHIKASLRDLWTGGKLATASKGKEVPSWKKKHSLVCLDAWFLKMLKNNLKWRDGHVAVHQCSRPKGAQIFCANYYPRHPKIFQWPGASGSPFQTAPADPLCMHLPKESSWRMRCSTSVWSGAMARRKDVSRMAKALHKGAIWRQIGDASGAGCKLQMIRTYQNHRNLNVAICFTWMCRKYNAAILPPWCNQATAGPWRTARILWSREIRTRIDQTVDFHGSIGSPCLSRD